MLDNLQYRHRGVRYEDKPRMYLTRGGEGIVHWGVELERECTHVLPVISTPDLIFTACTDGRLLRSSDGRQSWDLDHQPGMNVDDAPPELISEEVVYEMNPKKFFTETAWVENYAKNN